MGAPLATILLATAVAVLGALGPAQPAAALHTVQAATWGTVATTGGGFVTGLAAPPTDASGTMYARTDIGGAYRRTTAGGRWEPITDFLPGLGDSAYGVDGLAVDATDPQNVWAAVGRVRGSGSPASPTPTGSGAVLRSTDGGATWTDMSYPSATTAVISGNMDGRWFGHRLAVDPFNDDRAYFATRADGLWIHDNGTWSKVPSVPDTGGGINPATPADREGYTTNPVGVSFVAIRENQSLGPVNDRVRVVYAAVWDVGVYKSIDGGATFTLLPGSPKRLRQGMISRRDNVFYGVGELNGAGSTMALWRLEPDNSWTNEQPCGASCTGKDVASIDIDNGGNIVVGVRVRGVRAVHPIYYCPYASSTSCVGRWTNIAGNATQQGWRDDENFTGTEHTSSLRFAPHASGAQATKLWVADFYGTATGTLSGGSWSFVDSTLGIELTATTDIVAASPNSSTFRAWSGALDVSGMYHDDVATTPDFALPQQNEAAAGGSQDTTGIDVGPTGIVYRVGRAPSGHTRPGGYSTNTGTSWTGFTNSSPAAYGGRIAVAPDNPDRLVWLPEAATLRHSTNRGTSWTVLGSPSTSSGVGWDTDISMPLASSQVSNGSATDDDFYYFDPDIGFHRATTSGSGLTFASIANGLPTGDNQSWPGMRFGIETDPLRKDVVVAGVCGSTAASNGFWFSSNRGTTMTKRTGISCAQSVAIGAPLTSGGNSTIYVLGREPGGSSTPQVFFSTDDGVTWKRMDRAGLVTTTALTHIEADPKIPGRVYLGSKGRGIFTGTI